MLFARATLYTNDADEHLRFIAFTRAALMACREMRWAPRIVHCNDWHTAFAPLFLRTVLKQEPLFATTSTLMTIHNIGYQGVFGATASQTWACRQRRHRCCTHRTLRPARSMRCATGSSTRMPSAPSAPPTRRDLHARVRHGAGRTLRERRQDLSGILNGVDYEEWDPRVDRYLPTHFDPQRLSVKADLKRSFLTRLSLDAAPGVPLAGVVSRLATQKGFELMYETLPGSWAPAR